MKFLNINKDKSLPNEEDDEEGSYRLDERDRKQASLYAKDACSEFSEEKTIGKSDLIIYARLDFLEGVRYAMNKMKIKK